MNDTYERWLSLAVADPDLLPELEAMEEPERADAFRCELEFGTAGLRGKIGAGTNRMNVYTVGKATQGLCEYLKAHANGKACRVAISRDSRIKSDLFAKVTAGIFAANGIHVHIYEEISPVPTLSFATRYLGCDLGVMITASHNPAVYNGYKVYGPDGCQIGPEVADEVLRAMGSIDPFQDIHSLPFEEGMAQGKIEYIKPKVMDAYIEQVKAQSLLGSAIVDKNVSIVYSPLHGTGLVPVTRALREMSFTNITIVKEQELPDGNFTTCPYPNPEIKEALALGLEYAAKVNADLMMATDPDCDRVGIAVKAPIGEYCLLTGNEVGMLLLDYICSRRLALCKMPPHPVMVKTIVTTDMAEKIAAHYGVEARNVLTGFKYIGDQIGELERQGRLDDYLFGFEESYGYLSGTYVRDKDGVNAATLIAEMFAYYRSQGVSLLDKLHQLYSDYGYTKNTLHSYAFEGAMGMQKMNGIMAQLRHGVREFGGKKVLRVEDYAQGINGLPKSNVLKYYLEDGISLVVRPSGTEPKLKLYVSVSTKVKKEAGPIEEKLVHSFEGMLS